jgi:hypothetical protein
MMYKVLANDMRSCLGGSAQWTPGERMEVSGDLVPCKNGLHICRNERDLIKWIGECVCPVIDYSTEYVDDDSKRVCRWVTIGEPIPHWNKRTARHFACDCAQYALTHARRNQRELLQACIDIARAYADWPDEWDAARASARDAARDAARASAWAAARDAAWAAARDAAWAAARDAAGAAARDAAGAAARDAAGDAARASAWDAAGDYLVALLAAYMDGTSEWVIHEEA